MLIQIHRGINLKKVCYYIFLILFFLIFTNRDSLSFDSTLAVRLQYTLDSVSVSQNLKGVSSAVTIPGQGTWFGVSGVSHSNVYITQGMYFGIASNTKTFMSALLLRLAELNYLALDDSLYNWIPNFQFIDSTITIRQLLNHTSGIYDFTSNPNYVDSILANPNRVWTPEELLIKFLGPPYFPKGQGFHYSNTNYIIAGMIIKAATNSAVSVQLRNLILNPLNLNNTFLPIAETVPDTIAHPWSNGIDISGVPRTSMLSAAWTAGAMYSTSENMTRWYQLLFEGQVISQASLEQMLSFTQQSGYGYGLGLVKYSVNGRILWGHDGAIPGYTSSMLYDTTMKMSITVLINQFPENAFIVSTALLNTVISQPIWINNNKRVVLDRYLLHQNYPNPFNPVTTLKYKILHLSFVRLTVYDIIGRKVKTLYEGIQSSGDFEVSWDGKDLNGNELATGIYLYRLEATSKNRTVFSETKKMMLIR